MNLIEAMDDPNLFGRQFAGPSWTPWRAFIAMVFGLPVPPELRELARECTGYDQAPSSPVREAWVVAGRRAGKSRIFALIAVYFAATFKDWSEHLAPGERGFVLVIGSERQQADSIMGFIRALLKETPSARAPGCVRGRRRDLARRTASPSRSQRARTVRCVRRP